MEGIARKGPSSAPSYSENTPSPIMGKGKEKVSKFSSTLVVKGSTPDSSATKKVRFDKTELLLTKVQHTQKAALSTIFVLKPCLKVTTPRPTLRIMEPKPPDI